MLRSEFQRKHHVSATFTLVSGALAAVARQRRLTAGSRRRARDGGFEPSSADAARQSGGRNADRAALRCGSTIRLRLTRHMAGERRKRTSVAGLTGVASANGAPIFAAPTPNDRCAHHDIAFQHFGGNRKSATVWSAHSAVEAMTRYCSFSRQWAVSRLGMDKKRRRRNWSDDDFDQRQMSKHAASSLAVHHRTASFSLRANAW